MQIDIGIEASDRELIAARLSRVLADTYGLYLRTHAYHWNVTGPMFQTLHGMFETQYVALADAVDEIAERIRALGHPAPGSYKEFAALSSLEDEDTAAGGLEATEMIESLRRGHETVARVARAAFSVANAADDQPTCDLLTMRMRDHEKTAWMLRSLIQVGPAMTESAPLANRGVAPRVPAQPSRRAGNDRSRAVTQRARRSFA